MQLVITGSAMTTSVGEDKRSCFRAFCAGETGRKPLQAFPRDKFNVQYAYEVADRTDGRDRILRATELLAKTVLAAIEEAGIERSSRFCIIVGTGLRELRTLELFWTDSQPMSIDQLHFERMLNERLGTAAPVITISNACSASSFALALAEDFIRDGYYDHVVAGGCDTITESMFGLLDRVNPLHPDRVRPFDRDRQGVLMGDGAAAVVLETEDNAGARGVRPLSRVRAVGTSCDANHETAPDVDGIVRAIHDAYARAEVRPADIDFVMVHGTGTGLNDKSEAAAMRQAMGAAADRAWMSGLKSMTGHTSGASGLVGVVTAIEALISGIVPPTVGLDNVMPEAGGMRIVTDQRLALHAARIAQVNAFGFGGVNAVVILEKPA